MQRCIPSLRYLQASRQTHSHSTLSRLRNRHYLALSHLMSKSTLIGILFFTTHCICWPASSFMSLHLSTFVSSSSSSRSISCSLANATLENWKDGRKQKGAAPRICGCVLYGIAQRISSARFTSAARWAFRLPGSTPGVKAVEPWPLSSDIRSHLARCKNMTAVRQRLTR